ncbi:anti-sigma factor domain-containing protein [Streptomyces sp. NPDC048172]|uniref:anti-sigma factor n=1 Tax=Streptomyces sp. NPDC048172 TaxID=3365505 RepID=UPI00372391D6
MTAAELHTLTGAYALDALSEDESEAFERHLADCASCGLEVAELRATGARLGLAVAEQPPPELRARVLGRIGAVRQEPPRPPRKEPRPRGTGGTAGHPGTAGGRWSRARRWQTFALAASVAAVALGGVAVWQQRDADDARRDSARESARSAELTKVAEVLTAADARTVSSKRLPGGGSGTAVVSQRLDRAAFLASGMAPPPSGKVYQFWFDDHGTMRSAGLMGRDNTVLLDGKVDGARGMGITVEPGGGSSQPTSKPVALMAFPADGG